MDRSWQGKAIRSDGLIDLLSIGRIRRNFNRDIARSVKTCRQAKQLSSLGDELIPLVVINRFRPEQIRDDFQTIVTHQLAKRFLRVSLHEQFGDPVALALLQGLQGSRNRWHRDGGYAPDPIK